MKNPDSARRRLLAGLGAVAAQFGLPVAEAQDATKVMPKAFRVALENDQVRVLEFNGRPAMGICGEGMHSHPARLNVALSDSTALVTAPDGTVRKVDRKQGDVFWREAETHKTENVGAANARVLIIELKAQTTAKS